MGKIDFAALPRFAELPVRPSAPDESAWGVFGDADEVGCVNFLTEQGVVEAARLVRKGKVFRLDTRIGYGDPPLFQRLPVRHNIISFEPFGILGHDDSLDQYNTQEGSQWDGLAHMGHPRHRAFYNGVTSDQVKDGPDGKLGIHHWADRFVGRGLLIDAFKYRAEQGRPINPLDSEAYTLEDLTEALAAQAVQLKPGTILLVRTGWMQAYRAASAEQKRTMASLSGLRSCGIESSRDLVAWLWDNRVAALGTDCPAVEPWPWDFKDEHALHYRALALLGLPLGEQFELDALAADCADDKCYEFMMVSAPLNLPGGIASPPNAVAIK
jgi:kynurenine formamidase